MRKVAQQIAYAFAARKSARNSNTTTDGQAIYLHGNKIIERIGSGIYFSLAGWNTSTTRSRINDTLRVLGLPCRVYQVAFKPYASDVFGHCGDPKLPLTAEGWYCAGRER